MPETSPRKGKREGRREEREREREKREGKVEERATDPWQVVIIPPVSPFFRSSWTLERSFESFWTSIRSEELATLRVTWRLSRFGIIRGERERGKFGRFYQSRLVISRCAEKSKGSNFEVESRWISMDSTRGEEDDGRFFPSREDSVELSPGTYGGRRFYPWRLICLRPYDPFSSPSWGNIEWYLSKWM